MPHILFQAVFLVYASKTIIHARHPLPGYTLIHHHHHMHRFTFHSQRIEGSHKRSISSFRLVLSPMTQFIKYGGAWTLGGTDRITVWGCVSQSEERLRVHSLSRNVNRRTTHWKLPGSAASPVGQPPRPFHHGWPSPWGAWQPTPPFSSPLRRMWLNKVHNLPQSTLLIRLISGWINYNSR